MIIGLCGQANSGKDTAADLLAAKYGFLKISLSDPMKRFVQELYHFSDEHLWGSSALRSQPDLRYLLQGKTSHYMHALGRLHCADGQAYRDGVCTACGYRNSENYLSPRIALQELGTAWGRKCHEGTWVEALLHTVDCLEAGSALGYAPALGLVRSWGDIPKNASRARSLQHYTPSVGIVIPDIRFKSELRFLQGERNAQIHRIVRTETSLNGAASQHPSELEQLELADEDFASVIDNDADLRSLHSKISAVAEKYRLPPWPTLSIHTLLQEREHSVLNGQIQVYQEQEEDVPPFLREPEPGTE